MTTKQLLLLVSGVIGIFLFFSISLYFLFLFAPDILGLPPKRSATAGNNKNSKPYYDPKLTINKSEFDQIQTKILKGEIAVDDRTVLTKKNKILKDSLDLFNKALTASPTDNADGNTTKILSPKAMKDSLGRLNILVSALKTELVSTKNKVDLLEKLMASKDDSLHLANLKDFAKMYETSNPADVAKILEKIDGAAAAKILKMMSKKKAGKIIEAMKPEKVETIMLLGGNK